MAQKIISVSISKGDKEFMRERFLSPSRLLQERITQIRDEQDPRIMKKLAEADRHNEALKKKIEFLATRNQKVFDLISEKLSSEEIDQIINKI